MSEKENVLMVYLGMRLSDKGKPLHQWVEIPDDLDGRHISWREAAKSREAEMNSRTWKDSLIRSVRPGAQYLFNCERKDGVLSVYTGADNTEFKGFWGDPKDVREWQTRHDSARSQHVKQRKVEKELKRIRWQEGLDPLRRAYQTSTAAGRRAIIAMILEYLNRPDSRR